MERVVGGMMGPGEDEYDPGGTTTGSTSMAIRAWRWA